MRAICCVVAALMTASGAPALPAQDPPRATFAEWLEGVRTEAVTRGIREETVRQALLGVEEPLPVVIERDRAQAETVLPLESYLARRLTSSTIQNGRRMLKQHQTLLRRVEREYGVPGRVITAIWGIESNFGRFNGVRPTIAALATLAWDPRRSSLFRRELFSAFEILDRGDIELASLKGSWAGAMGQPQFMPSSYLAFAQDFDQDGRRDIWNSQADVFASIANYLKGHGWTAGARWGREVRLSEAIQEKASAVPSRTGSCQARRNMSIALPLAEWQRMGIKLANGAALPVAEQTASLVSGARRRFLVYENYDALLEYNCAHAYALSVALLADAF
jgi:membrane-bound lytic murein transglycosylase B